MMFGNQDYLDVTFMQHDGVRDGDTRMASAAEGAGGAGLRKDGFFVMGDFVFKLTF